MRKILLENDRKFLFVYHDKLTSQYVESVLNYFE